MSDKVILQTFRTYFKMVDGREQAFTTPESREQISGGYGVLDAREEVRVLRERASDRLVYLGPYQLTYDEDSQAPPTIRDRSEVDVVAAPEGFFDRLEDSTND